MALRIFKHTSPTTSEQQVENSLRSQDYLVLVGLLALARLFFGEREHVTILSKFFCFSSIPLLFLYHGSMYYLAAMRSDIISSCDIAAIEPHAFKMLPRRASHGRLPAQAG